MANPEHVALVRKGAEAIAEWRKAHPAQRLDLRTADLRRADLAFTVLNAADLRQANLFEANLLGAHLTGADLSRAELWRANLREAALFQANLRGADLKFANLCRADLSGANLTGANLWQANFSGANLSGANLPQTELAFTSLGGLDLSGVKGLTNVVHHRPSSIGVDTLIASFRGAGNVLTPELRTFFLGAGVPQELLDALPKIVSEIEYYSCFISYGQPDIQFATKLCADLEARGVSCWLWELDKTVGKPTWGEIEEQLDRFEKMVVLCSVDALLRDGVKKEIDKQIDKNPDKLVPVSLDSRWTQHGFKAEWGDRDLKTWLLDRNYADFANKPYEEALEGLLKGLRRPKAKKAGGAGSPPDLI